MAVEPMRAHDAELVIFSSCSSALDLSFLFKRFSLFLSQWCLPRSCRAICSTFVMFSTYDVPG